METRVYTDANCKKEFVHLTTEELKDVLDKLEGLHPFYSVSIHLEYERDCDGWEEPTWLYTVIISICYSCENEKELIEAFSGFEKNLECDMRNRTR